MQDLNRDPPTRGMNALCHQPVMRDVDVAEKPRRAGENAALQIWGHAAGDDQPDPAARPGRARTETALVR